MKDDLSKIMIPEQEIRERAYFLWKKNGKTDQENWLEAEEELRLKFLSRLLSPKIQELSAKVKDFSEDFGSGLISSLNSHLQDADLKDDQVSSDGQRYYRNYGKSQFMIIEESPRTRTIYLDTRFHDSYISCRGQYLDKIWDVPPINLAMPYVIYFIYTGPISGSKFRLEGLHLAFSNKPLTSLNQEVYVPLLPNLNEGSICDSHSKQSQGSTPLEAAQNAITNYWQSQFNYMLYHVAQSQLPPEVITYEKWAEETKKNPLFVLNVKWPTPKFLVSKYLKQGQNKRDGIGRVVDDQRISFVKQILEEISVLQPSKKVVELSRVESC